MPAPVSSAAPLLGVVIEQALPINEHRLALLLALFAGGFLYIGASELLPRSRNGPRDYGAGFAGMARIGIMACITHVVE